ncbi:unnamed protein product [Mortierella alpina]
MVKPHQLRTEGLLEQQPTTEGLSLHCDQLEDTALLSASTQDDPSPTSSSSGVSNDRAGATTVIKPPHPALLSVNTKGPFFAMQSNLGTDPENPRPREHPISTASTSSSGNSRSAHNHETRPSNTIPTLAFVPQPPPPQTPSTGIVSIDSALTRTITPPPQPWRSVSSATAQQSEPSIKQGSGQSMMRKRHFFPRRFRFRAKGVERPEESSSFKNKTAMFSNERTMLHWMGVTVNLGSLSLMLLSFGSNAFTPYIGVALIVVCLSVLIYSVTTFQVRMEWLLMSRDDVLYYDHWTPGIITLALFTTYALNLAIVLQGDFKPSQFPKGHIGGSMMGGDGSWS